MPARFSRWSAHKHQPQGSNALGTVLRQPLRGARSCLEMKGMTPFTTLADCLDIAQVCPPLETHPDGLSYAPSGIPAR